jgi:hypothetical protein
MTLYTAYLTAAYDTGLFFVGTFTTSEEASEALKNASHTLYTIPNILVYSLDVPVNKLDSDTSITLL